MPQTRDYPTNRSTRAGHPAANLWIAEHMGSGRVVKESFVSGSGWSSAYVMETEGKSDVAPCGGSLASGRVWTAGPGGRRFFVKTATGRDESMFRGEALGLQAMYDTNTIRIPQVHHYGTLESSPGSGPGGRGGSFIVMEHLDIRGGPSMAELGCRLARMHLAVPKDEHAAAGQFGFPLDNTLGGTPQANGWLGDWVVFLRDRRLVPQLQLTGDSRLKSMGEKLCAKLHTYFEGIK
ncbi:Protein-ribulosamine 3-kinase, chloroplastic, partial [Tetrabaena socialis]